MSIRPLEFFDHIRHASLRLCLAPMLDHASQAAPFILSSIGDSRNEGNRGCPLQSNEFNILCRNKLGRYAIKFQRRVHGEPQEAIGYRRPRRAE